jgi:protease-4
MVGIAVGVILSMVGLGAAALVGGAIGFAAGAAGGAAAGGLGGAFGAGSQERRISGAGPEKVAVIRVTGPITREAATGFFDAGASSRRIVELLDRAERDVMVKAVILDMDTPGGSVVASDEIHQKLQAVRRQGKIVVTLMTETAASGGYYIAAGTDRIVADPTTITGSIGVIVALANLEDLSRKIGIRTIVFKSGAFKDLGNPNRAVTHAEAAIFQNLVDEAYQRFVGVVARGRRLDRATVARLADGRIYTGQQAARLRLVDSLGHFPEAVQTVKRLTGLEDPLFVEYGGDGVLRALLGSRGQRLRLWMLGPEPGLERLSPTAAPFSLQYLLTP